MLRTTSSATVYFYSVIFVSPIKADYTLTDKLETKHFKNRKIYGNTRATYIQIKIIKLLR